MVLSLIVSLFLWFRLLPKWWHVVLMVGLFLLMQGSIGVIPMRTHVRIMMSYVMLAALILPPILLVLRKTSFRHGIWIAIASVSICIALVFRFLDPISGSFLRSGTHWLWHTFGAITTHCLAIYLVKLPEAWRASFPASEGPQGSAPSEDG